MKNPAPWNHGNSGGRIGKGGPSRRGGRPAESQGCRGEPGRSRLLGAMRGHGQASTQAAEGTEDRAHPRVRWPDPSPLVLSSPEQGSGSEIKFNNSSGEQLAKSLRLSED